MSAVAQNVVLLSVSPLLHLLLTGGFFTSMMLYVEDLVSFNKKKKKKCKYLYRPEMKETV